MTRDEFALQQHQLACQHCGHVGLTREDNPNNGGSRPICPSCGRSPLAGVQWLAKSEPRTPKRGRVAVLDVWASNGDHCSFCGKSRDLCVRLGLGLTAQHVVPFAVAADDWPLIPFCARCQQASAASLAETIRVQNTIGGLDAIIQRMEQNNPELR